MLRLPALLPSWPPNTRHLAWPVSKVRQDRAVRPLVATAGVRKVLQRVLHRLHLGDLAFQPVDLLLRQMFDVGAVAAPVTGKTKAPDVLPPQPNRYEADTGS